MFRDTYHDELTQAVEGALTDRLCRTVRELHAHGWCLGTGGNFSVRLDDDPLRLRITRSGLDKRRVNPAELVEVDARGEAVFDGAAKPSAESLLHATIVTLTDAQAVLHTHSVWGTLLGEHFEDRGGFTLHGYEMLKGLEGVRTHEAEVFVPVLANSQDMPALAAHVRELLRERPSLQGFLVAGHGLYTWGRTLAQAQRHVEIYEFLFECVGRRTHFAPFEG